MYNNINLSLGSGMKDKKEKNTNEKKIYIKKHPFKKKKAVNKSVADELDKNDDILLVDSVEGDEKVEETSSKTRDSKSGSKVTSKKKTKRSRQKKLKIWISVLCSLLIIGILVVGNLPMILAWTGLSDTGNFSNDLAGNRKYQKLAIKNTLYENLDANINFADQNVINILFFGMDESIARESRYSSFRPDTIMLLTVNLDTQDIQITSIPRDSRVPIAGRSGKDKINACFYYGTLIADNEEDYFDAGVECLMGTVSELLGGVQINYYIGVNMDGVPDIIDTIGGVTFDVEDEINLDGVTIHEGEQVLDGKQFLLVARFRHYAGGDIDRVKVQQKLLLALFDQLTSSESIMKLPKAISQTFDIITTDLTFKQITTLAFTLKDFDLSSISTDTVPGLYGNLYGVSYWIINQSARVDFVKETYGITIRPDAQDPTYIPKEEPAEEDPTDDETVTEDPPAEDPPTEEPPTEEPTT